ncbi:MULTISPECIES: DNA cytosine methyltransferase [Pseudomonas]|uniref:DNA (Cytosine-5)-methyltransferase 1 n=1 Tax=Pseudomonas umsongensis TaxID=198618 RepID=A0ACC5ME14_9PSED|nr:MULTISPECIES: DNA cytosine methyltransferase [Pseudomonas]MBB2886992.1 DNA (cytosine-5)-methyltransferase 1 [Pseudomonas umsongensis]NMN78442.1 DNA (cytosine-5)-methyltransferase 1 [Pseudomonas sp. KD5]
MTSFDPTPITTAVKTQFGLNLAGGIRVDLFAGGGGATMGQEMATDIPVDIAINHNADAISMHKRNHPSAEHYITDVYDVCPRMATRGRPVDHLHASPECTHHSLAAGGQARSTTSRSLSWVIIKWAGQVSPDMITMENVTQILQWGPLIAKRCPKTGRVVRRDLTVAAVGERVPVQDQYLVPNPKRKGRTWRHFECQLRAMGYDLMHGKLKACDFGAATTRERLFMIARRDGKLLRWPEPTHFKNPGKGQLPYRTAASCIDWSIPCPSIFLTKEEGRAAGVKRPLVNNTMERLRKGAKRYVVEHKNPFIVSVNHSDNDLSRCHSVQDLAKTITGAHGFALVTPQLAPFITEHANGSSQRNMPGDDPLRTICSGVKGGHFAVAVAYVAQHNGGYNETPGHHPTQPLTAITTTGSQQQIVTAHLATLRRNCVGRSMDELVPTITAGAEHHALVKYTLAPEIEAGALRVASFLMGYYGSDNVYDLRDPAATITTRDRLALVTVTIKGTPYVIVDIGMRMLTPRELYRAQGFPDNYIIDTGHDGRKFSNKTQVMMVGNSVSPWPMMALVNANKVQVDGVSIGVAA